MIDPQPQNAPPEVKERAAQLNALLSSDDSLPPDDDMSMAEKEEVAGVLASTGPLGPTPAHLMRPVYNDPLQAFSEALVDYGDSKEVKIHTPIGVITLRALHVSINNYGVGLILNKKDMILEPAFGSELTLEVGGRPMNVVYAGGLFTFNKIPVTFLSFLRITEQNEETKDNSN